TMKYWALTLTLLFSACDEGVEDSPGDGGRGSELDMAGAGGQGGAAGQGGQGGAAGQGGQG
ncbi:MAG: hypothetical protein KC549_08480, partial [Myxococcales bacterium]|nr:hypothetical protein [Myxococcales bacterium]